MAKIFILPNTRALTHALSAPVCVCVCGVCVCVCVQGSERPPTETANQTVVGLRSSVGQTWMGASVWEYSCNSV